MPLPSRFQGLIDKAEQRINKEIQSRVPSAPPIPTFSKPRSQSGNAYWQPQFLPHEPVSTHFQHETGNGDNGWGNAEIENYTTSDQNSFHGPSNTLVLRAVVNRSLEGGRDAHFTSARLISHQTLSRPRGSLSARIVGPTARGVWPAFWLLPRKPFSWPTDGEMDIFEMWNGDTTNHSCLHWGFHDDPSKHQVVTTPLHNVTRGDGTRFDFAWDEDESTGKGRMVWYIDSKPVMVAGKPPGTRKLSDFCIIINVALGGQVCGGVEPDNGTYEMTIKDLAMWDEPPGGWNRFNADASPR